MRFSAGVFTLVESEQAHQAQQRARTNSFCGQNKTSAKKNYRNTKYIFNIHFDSKFKCCS